MKPKSKKVKTESAVAQLIFSKIISDHFVTPYKDIANSCGYNTPNNISMICHGKSKLPIYRAIRLANAIELEPTKFVLMCVEENHNPVYEALNEIGILPRNDTELDALIIFFANMRKNNSK